MIKNRMKKAFIIFISILAFSPTSSARRDKPLANEGISGLYARSIEQVLRLREDEVDLATAVLIVSENWSDMVYGRRYLSRLDDMAREIRERLSEKKIPTNYRAIPVINEYLFEELGFNSLSEATDPNSLFLHTVLDKKEGYCLSLSILYLSIAERIGLDIYGVVVPGHFFVRYDDGHERFNIETTSKGGIASDEEYIKKFNVPESSRDSIYMKNLNKIQTLGCFFNNLGNSYSDVGNIDQAFLALKRAVEINPGLSESRANLGNIYLLKGQLNLAKNEYITALNINPDDAKTHNNLGNAYVEQDRLSSAISEYSKAINLDPNFVDAYKNIAIAYFKQERYALAIRKLNKALDLKPDDISCYMQLGEIYHEKEEYQKAIDQYKKILKIQQNYAEAYYGMGICYNKLGMVDNEILSYMNALAIEPNMFSALVNLGNIYFEQKKYTLAIEQYKKAILVRSDVAMIYYNLGAAYSNDNNYEQAINSYLKVIELNPDNGDAHYGLAYGFYNQKKYDLAWKHINKAKELGVDVGDDLLKAIKNKL